MSKDDLLSRIAINPGVMGGKPVIQGTRLTVQYILKLLVDGWTFADIEKEYEGISVQDISACVLYASEVLAQCSGRLPDSFIVASEDFVRISKK
jgi:uncharacterized protein (DUF433 family)